MKDLFVSYGLAVALEELGFNKPCLANYYSFGDGEKRDGKYGQTDPELFINESLEQREEELGLYAFHVVRVPLFQQVFDWFREEYNLTFFFIPSGKPVRWGYVIPACYLKDKQGSAKTFTTYKEAEIHCINALIEIIKQKNYIEQ